ncbi:MAG TPA: CPBP family intramembrane glutamic endopeptidase [Chitinophagaceae bacterium]|nr:CPBP family intramembrane glutamic endopeptidase [Chitinophagaceae bacterium]
MRQLSKTRSILYHLYPGVIITICFAILAPVFVKYGLPPQLSVLVAIAIAAVPLFILHLNKARINEHKNSLRDINPYKRKLSTGKLVLSITGLVIFAFIIWGATQPLNQVITQKLLSWLPDWYTVQDFHGYGKRAILITLILNLLLNGIIAPLAEEYYFRGYLLPRMENWGKWSFVLNTVLFSLYHFWQPYVYLTLIMAMMPMVWLIWKTKDLRVGIYTHCALNIIGALASFGLLIK